MDWGSQQDDSFAWETLSKQLDNFKYSVCKVQTEIKQNKVIGKRERLWLGNFRHMNPVIAFLDRILEWMLVHRNEADMDRLYRKSKFCTACTKLVFDAEGIDMFAEAKC